MLTPVSSSLLTRNDPVMSFTFIVLYLLSFAGMKQGAWRLGDHMIISWLEL